MAAHNPATGADERGEAYRVSIIFGVLTLFTLLQVMAIIAVVLAVTTGQGTQVMLIGLIPAAMLALGCSVGVARRTWANFQLPTPPASPLRPVPE